MKTPSRPARCLSLAILAATACLSFIACAPPSGSNNANSSGNSKATVTPPTTASPSPSPSCDDNAINQQLVAIFTDRRNAYGPEGFEKIQNTVNFYSRDCKIYLWGYTKNLGTFKKLVRVSRDVPRTVTASFVDMENLYIERSEYPYLKAHGCAPGYKACGDICIPEGDSCWTEIVISAE